MLVPYVLVPVLLAVAVGFWLWLRREPERRPDVMPPVPPPPPARRGKARVERSIATVALQPKHALPPEPADLFRAALGEPKPPPVAVGEHPQLTKLRAYIRLGLLAAKADGRIAKSERLALREFLAEKFGHDAALVRHFDPLLEQVEKALPAEADVLAEVRALTSLDERPELFALAERVAVSSGERNPRKIDFLARVAQALGITPTARLSAQAATVAAKPAPPATSPRAELEIPAAAELSVELIRRKYALLADRLDPAKAAALGADFAHLANDKRIALRRAAEELLAPFNAPLEKPAAPPPPADLRHNPDLDDVFGG